MTTDAGTGRLLYSATMSLDGFIAGVGGDMAWLSEHLAPEQGPDLDALPSENGALLIGRRTFEGDDPNKGTDAEGAFGGRSEGPSVVLTHVPPPDTGDVALRGDLLTAVQAAKRAAGRRYVNVLGASVAVQCLEAGVLDEILVLVAPVLLGDGIRLFAHPGGTDIRLQPLPERSGPAHLWFRVGS